MAHLACQYPDLRFITVSPGNTTGTEAAAGAAPPLRFAATHIMPRLGISHELDVRAKRLVDGVTDSRLSSGVFYARAAGELKDPRTQCAHPLANERRHSCRKRLESATGRCK
jgi:hypothetical protein